MSGGRARAGRCAPARPDPRRGAGPRRPEPVRGQDAAPHRGRGDGAPSRRPAARRGTRQSQLDRDHAARCLLPPGPLRARGVPARLGRARSRRHARAAGHRGSARHVPGAERGRHGAALLAATVDYGLTRLRHRRLGATNWSTASSATTTPGPIACSRARRARRARVPRRRVVRAANRPTGRSTCSRSRAAPRRCATSSTSLADNSCSSRATPSR